MKARFVLLNRRIPRRVGELPVEQTPQRYLRAGAAVLGCEPVVDVSAFWFLDDEPRFSEEPQMARHPGLCDAQDAGQLADIEAILRQHAQQSEAGAVGQQAKESRGALHCIYKSTYIDMTSSISVQLCAFSRIIRFHTRAPHGPHTFPNERTVVSYGISSTV